MGMADKIKSNLDTAQNDQEVLLKNQFNSGTKVLMEKFLENVQAGEVSLNSINDYNQLFKIFQEVNHLTSEDGAEGNGNPPKLSLAEEDSIENKLKVDTKRVMESDGQMVDKKQIDINDIKNLSEKDVNDIAIDRTTVLNNRNGGFDVD